MREENACIINFEKMFLSCHFTRKKKRIGPKFILKHFVVHGIVCNWIDTGRILLLIDNIWRSGISSVLLYV